MKTRLCDLLEIEHPIVSAPMGGAAGPELVAAVSNAGGLGAIPLWTVASDAVPDAIAQVRARTDRHFAVNLNLSFPHEAHLQACIDAGVFAVSLFWGQSPDAIETARRGGLRVMMSVGTAHEARQAAEAGADVIVAQGWEAGGHVWGKVATMALVPAVVDAVDVPVVAAGGIADGRAMAAALMLGADGVWIGTRFLASEEACIHDTYRARVLAADESQTQWAHDLYDVNWPDAPHRVLETATTRDWAALGRPGPGARPGEGQVIGHRSDGAPVARYTSYTPLRGTTGDVAAMSLWAGQGVAQVRRVQPAAAILREIRDDAERLIRDANARLNLG